MTSKHIVSGNLDLTQDTGPDEWFIQMYDEPAYDNYAPTAPWADWVKLAEMILEKDAAQRKDENTR